MNTEKLRKISGLILLIKSYIFLLLMLLSIFCTCLLIVSGCKGINEIKNPTQPPANIYGVLSIILGSVFLVITVVVIIYFVVYFINSRRILKSTKFPKGSIICMIIFEYINVLEGTPNMIESVLGENVFIAKIIYIVITIQCVVTILLLILDIF